MTVLVTRTAESVVICTGPSLLPLKPFFRSSDVLSVYIQLLGNPYILLFLLPRGGSSPTAWRQLIAILIIVTRIPYPGFRQKERHQTCSHLQVLVQPLLPDRANILALSGFEKHLLHLDVQ